MYPALPSFSAFAIFLVRLAMAGLVFHTSHAQVWILDLM
jgi:hypothetical protein